MLKQNNFLQFVFLLSPHFLKNFQASLYSATVAMHKYGKTFHFWSSLLKESQYYDSNRINQLQIGILSNFLYHTFNNSPFYTCYEKKIPSLDKDVDIGSMLRPFPIINKQIVRKAHTNILGSNKKRRLFKFSTSGTTGSPLHVYLDLESYQREYAFRWNLFSLGKAQRRSRFAFFVGNTLFDVNQNKPPYHIMDYYGQGIYFSLFHMSKETMRDYLSAFNSYKPEFIKGYPSGLYTFASYVKKHGHVFRYPKAIFSASEMLRDYQKALLEEVFQAPVYQWYGQVETTVNIQECENRKLHVKEEYGFLELINDKGEKARSGEIARAVGTGWGNKAFPLIRYDTGDSMILAKNQQCSCGRTGRVIERIIGRDEDVITSPRGRIIGRLDFVFKPIDTVKEAQIVQENISALTIRVVPLEKFANSDKKKIIQILKLYLGDDFVIKVEEVDELEKTTNGKVKYVISRL